MANGYKPTQEQVHAEVTREFENWLDDKQVYMNPWKKAQLLQQVHRLADRMYADGYYDGQRTYMGRTSCQTESMGSQLTGRSRTKKE